MFFLGRSGTALGYPLPMSKGAFFLRHFKHLEIEFQIQEGLEGCLYKWQKEMFADSFCLKIHMHIFILPLFRSLSARGESLKFMALSIDCKGTKDK